MLEIGSLVGGKYRILNKIGQGGMSVVYLAINERANKTWAVKEVRKDGVMDSKAVEQQLIVETNILMNLKHKYLPSIIDVIEDESSFIMVMDYIEGKPLSDTLKSGALEEDDVATWGVQLCEVLGYLHTQKPKIIYRDMKPANVMLKPDGDITLIDFGAARKFKEGNLEDTTSFGSPQYAAPEQFAGRQTDERTDIYGLGATLYHLLTGIAPPGGVFPVPSICDTNPTLSTGLDTIIQKCTQPEPNNRYQNAAELAFALAHYKELEEAYRKRQKRKLVGFSISCLLTLAFAATSIWGYIFAENKKQENYDNKLFTTNSIEDYYEAILTDPTRTEAYLGNNNADGLIEFLVKDGILTSEESQALIKLRIGLDTTGSRGYSTTVDVLERLKEANPSGYEDVCYDIGDAFLFNYDIGVEKDKYAAAAAWFQYAQSAYPDAVIYCDISNCLQDISKYSTLGQYGRLSEEYETLWSNINTLLDSVEDLDEGLRLQVWNETLTMIRNHTTEFCQVVGSDKVVQALDRILADGEKIENVFMSEELRSLSENISSTIAKVGSVRLEAEVAE